MTSLPELSVSDDESTAIRVIRRKLNQLAKSIYGVVDLGKRAFEAPDIVPDFEIRLERVRESWDLFQQRWDSLDELYVKAKETFPKEGEDEFYAAVLQEIDNANVLMLKIKRKGGLPQLNATVMGDHSFTSRSHHLPRIKVPQFDGDLVKWCNFRDLFLSLVHEEPSLSKVEKFNYLKDALKGEPISLIAKLSVTEDTYDQAWSSIKNYYDNPRVLATHHLKKVLDFSPKGSRPSFEAYQDYLSCVVDSIESFKNLQLEDSTDFLLTFLALRKLDSETRREFELANLSNKFPTTNDVFNYIRNRITALRLCFDRDSRSSSIETNYSSNTKSRSFPRRNSPKYSSSSGSASTFHVRTVKAPSSSAMSTSSAPASSKRNSPRGSPERGRKPSKVQCPFCQQFHALHLCIGFNDLGRRQRLDFMTKWKGCSNCLREGHAPNSCPSRYSCRFCNKKHHSLLHDDHLPPQPNKVDPSPSKSVALKIHESVGHRASEPGTCTLLPTAQVHVKSQKGELIRARALLDTCSQHTFMSHELARRLGTPVCSSDLRIEGLEDVPLNKPMGSTECTIVAYDSEVQTRAHIVKCISSASPRFMVNRDVVDRLRKQELADEHFGDPLPVDLLLGGGILPRFSAGSFIPTDFPGLFLWPTVFGLVALGELSHHHSSASFTMLTSEAHPNIDFLLERFWKIEEPEVVLSKDPSDAFCETHFLKEHQRTSSGRYVVKMPPNHQKGPVGDNRSLVTRRFLNLERKLHADPELKKQYVKFMSQYLELGHMSLAESRSSYLIPHHGIWQGANASRKLRVVFDASCPSKSSRSGEFLSLNDTLLSGPKLQLDISDVLTRFRLYMVALTCDLVKMYRQVLVHPDQRYLQHILWREDPSQPLQEFELNTLTYGVKPCAFLAIRTVGQLLIDEGQKYPLAASKVPKAMYVDDFVSGANSVAEALQLIDELIHLFGKGGFSIDKWSSNIPEVLADRRVSAAPLELSDPDDQSIKILGMIWEPIRDVFSYAVVQPTIRATKRSVLSAMARIFDPLGLLAPVIFSVKCLMQDIWKAHLGWDDPLTEDLNDAWNKVASKWDILSQISIPRRVTCPGAKLRLIGFCDASQRGSAAVVFLRSESSTGEVSVSLIKAKTKVAPIKYLSIARLELCGALLLARLLSSIDIPECDISQTVCLTDSMVVLSWLRTPPYKLKTFEANRVTAILEKTSPDSWHHVKSEDNPADVASRGRDPHGLLSLDLWWKGPCWLKTPIKSWPIVALANPAVWMNEVSAAFVTVIEGTSVSSNPFLEVISRFSSLNILVRTFARVIRFLRRKKGGPILASEHRYALFRLVYVTQRSLLPSCLYKGDVPAQFRDLSPFIDGDGIVRVGGRLEKAPVSYDQRHPALIPRDSHLSRLLVDDCHVKNLHSGPSLTLALVRRKFWIPGGLRFVKGRLMNCVNCRTRKAKPLRPLMGSLPKERFAQFKAFVQTGVDFAGPFYTKESRRRRSPRNPVAQQKAYLCIFVCLASKAVHLECVSSLSTPAFLAALDRFVSRRGTPQSILSDNGSNFIGASNYLKDVYEFLRQQNDVITEALSPLGIEWRFIPPRAPHFGGMWEAGVKSVKNLLSSAMGTQGFTFEELSTTFTRVEGILNSRPLCPLSEDPEQWDFLTPGHFICGTPLHLIPDLVDEGNHRSRWDMIRHQVNHVWDRWRKEYLHHLQQRGKWQQGAPDLKSGDLVILLEKRCITGQWPVARVVELHPGQDGNVRVVSVQTPSGGVFKRAVSNLAPLFPIGS